MAEKPYIWQRRTLSNGLRVATVEMPHLHSATLSIYVRVGSRHESQRTNGISHFLEHMLFRGCDGFADSTALNTAMEDLGGTLDGFTMRDFSAFHSTVHPEFLDAGAGILGRMFRSPSFRDLEVERSLVLEEILDSVDARGRMIDLDAIAHRQAFPDHPLSYPIDGLRRNVRRFGIQELEAHRERFYCAKNMVICVAGKITPAEAFDSVERHFGGLSPGAGVTEEAPSASENTGKLTFTRWEDNQTRARISFRTSGASHEDHAALILLRRVLDGGLSARLPARLIEQKGIAYEAHANCESYFDCGLFNFEFAVAHAKLGMALDEIRDVLQELLMDGVGAEELDRVRRRTRIGLEFSLDSAHDLSDWFGSTELFCRPQTPEERMKALDAITESDVRSVARTYFTRERMTAAACGGANAGEIRSARRSIRQFSEALEWRSAS